MKIQPYEVRISFNGATADMKIVDTEGEVINVDTIHFLDLLFAVIVDAVKQITNPIVRAQIVHAFADGIQALEQECAE